MVREHHYKRISVLMIPPPPRSTLFPYTTLFRSGSTHPPWSVRSLSHAQNHRRRKGDSAHGGARPSRRLRARHRDRKSTRLNSSHVEISYAVFCLKKKKTKNVSYTFHTVS